MSIATLNALLTTLEIASAPRYTIEEVANILGLTLRQVRVQVKKGNLVAIRGSLRRWTGVLHDDLADYYSANNGGAL